ncbi:hypothetical protein GCM10008941_34060 [Rhizomicrobium palustre]
MRPIEFDERLAHQPAVIAQENAVDQPAAIKDLHRARMHISPPIMAFEIGRYGAVMAICPLFGERNTMVSIHEE